MTCYRRGGRIHPIAAREAAGCIKGDYLFPKIEGVPPAGGRPDKFCSPNYAGFAGPECRGDLAIIPANEAMELFVLPGIELRVNQGMLETIDERTHLYCGRGRGDHGHPVVLRPTLIT